MWPVLNRATYHVDTCIPFVYFVTIAINTILILNVIVESFGVKFAL